MQWAEEEHKSSVDRALDPIPSTTNKDNCWCRAGGTASICGGMERFQGQNLTSDTLDANELHMEKMAMGHLALDGISHSGTLCTPM